MKIINREPEAHFIELLSVVQEQRQGWSAVHFAFSNLLEHYRSEYQLKIAINLMNDLMGDRDGAIYHCEDATIYVLAKNISKPLMDKMIFQLRYLFMDDPLSYTPEGDENPEFAHIYNVEEQWQELNDSIKRRMVARVRKAQGLSTPQRIVPKTMSPAMAAAGIGQAPPVKKENKYFDSSSLATVERDLRSIDIGKMIRRQPVCAAIQDMPMRTVFDEMYINIAHLRQMLATDVDLLSNRWLFKYLTQILDEKMLNLVRQNITSMLATPLSLNLNVPTLLSNTFTEFDASVKPGSKVSIVLELQIADVFSDMSAFLTAKDVVQKLGYRVCLDGVTDLSFPQIDRKRLGFDLIKLQWNAETQYNEARDKKLVDAIKECGSNRVIMTRCDNEAAVRYGQALGISLFQGRYLDSVVNPKSLLQN
ncbi:MAG: EAL domain-containing protein [Alphaproteobacteria bacterium]|nr:EAL domain-containing protein [Alphaproteobacteria bacterium]